MDRHLFLIALVLFPCTLRGQELNIIPHPQKVEIHEGFFDLGPSTLIVHSNGLDSEARQLKDYLDVATGFNLIMDSSRHQTSQIHLSRADSLEYLGMEGYILEVKRKLVSIKAYHPLCCEKENRDHSGN